MTNVRVYETTSFLEHFQTPSAGGILLQSLLVPKILVVQARRWSDSDSKLPHGDLFSQQASKVPDQVCTRRI